MITSGPEHHVPAAVLKANTALGPKESDKQKHCARGAKKISQEGQKSSWGHYR